MKPLDTSVCAALLIFSVACADRGERSKDAAAAPPEQTLTGQVLLPSGLGSRGVEVLVDVAAASDGRPSVRWVLFDEQGRFAHTFRGSLTTVTVTAGGGGQVHRIERDDLPEASPTGPIELGVIDLRERLMRHRLRLRAADGRPSGDVRVGMWHGPPPTGPGGQPVSLGSRQFPEIELGSEVEWLVPARDAHSIYFLVERPDGAGRGREWRSGHQRLFGPFDAAGGLPTELVVD